MPYVGFTLAQGAVAAEGNQAAEKNPTQKQVPRPAPNGPSGKLQGNALFNITAHLGLGGPGASRALPPSRSPLSVSSRQANQSAGTLLH